MLPKPAAIPRRSGCYLFRNDSGDVIYVGKARNLAQRLSSYFQHSDTQTYKTQLLMDEATSVEWIITPSELDALVLENELIKQNQPRYNMRLKDDKSFPYVALDLRTPFGVPYTTRGVHHRGVKYFGPFVDVRALRLTMDELLQAFPLRTCSTHKFQYHQRITRPCLLYDIGKCSGPCIGAVSEEQYAELANSWSRFFEGDVRPLHERLSHQMNRAAEQRHYEAAARARDGLNALERAAESQSVVLDDHSNLDVISLAHEGSRTALVRFRVRFGRVIGRSVHLVDRSMDEEGTEVVERLLTELYDERGAVPPEVLLDTDVTPTQLMSQFLTERRGRPVRVHSPERGKRRRVVEMAAHDATSVMERDSLRRQVDHNVRSRALQELANAIGLESPPYRIECYDMSHLQGTNYVGSMVVMEDGLPVKKEYRHFNVREVLGNDDAGAMREVLRRRLSHWGEASNETRFHRSDLLVIDGGLPQLHAAQSAAHDVGLDGEVEFVAIAKREELLYRPGRRTPIALERGSEALYLIQRLRDEAHRFAITFHRSKRGKGMVRSALEGIAGLGPMRQERLMTHFGSLDALRGATLAELMALTWLPNDVARRTYDHVQSRSVPRASKEDIFDE